MFNVSVSDPKITPLWFKQFNVSVPGPRTTPLWFKKFNMSDSDPRTTPLWFKQFNVSVSGPRTIPLWFKQFNVSVAGPRTTPLWFKQFNVSVSGPRITPLWFIQFPQHLIGFPQFSWFSATLSESAYLSKLVSNVNFEASVMSTKSLSNFLSCLYCVFWILHEPISNLSSPSEAIKFAWLPELRQNLRASLSSLFHSHKRLFHQHQLLSHLFQE